MTKIISQAESSRFLGFIRQAEFGSKQIPVCFTVIVHRCFCIVAFPFTNIPPATISLVKIITEYVHFPAILPVVYIIQIKMVADGLVGHITEILNESRNTLVRYHGKSFI